MTRASLTLSLALALAPGACAPGPASFFHGANPAREGTSNYDPAEEGRMWRRPPGAS